MVATGTRAFVGVHMRLAFLLALAACGTPSDDPSSDGTPSAPDDGSSTPDDGESLTCGNPKPSTCDEGAVVRGVVTAPDTGPQAGDLVVFLTHHDLGQDSEGGYYHTSTVYEDVDLSEGPQEIQIDMCEGGEMWPDDYGAYNLIAILDQNGNNAPDGFNSNRLPDAGEPSLRKFPVKPEQGGESPCFDDLVLDCTDGASCTAY
jgi:hypothetical protein